MTRTDDPLYDFMCYDDEQQAVLDELPRCDCCDEPIQDEYYYEINGSCMCEECLIRNHQKFIA